MSRSIRIAVIGDVHLQWNAADVRYFNESAYDLILFVGDLATYAHKPAVAVARSIAELRRPALVVLGNHDGVHLGQLVAEVARKQSMSDVLGGGQGRRCDEIEAALEPARLCGYSLHPVPGAAEDVTVVAARPHSMGGSYVAYRRFIQQRFGVASIDDSARRLCELVDAAPQPQLIFFAHNGPSGLGPRRADIWGCDFRKAEGDWGDDDLRQAIAHARAAGKQVRAVLAGHMHHHVKASGGAQRSWRLEREGIVYVNAARVPRIFGRNGQRVHHHVAVSIDLTATDRADCGVRVDEVLVPVPRPA